jgi:predicted site-specific integrase-resolvase
LAASGAKKEILDDLERACDGLKPFAEHQIKDFAGFLVRAEEYSRTGVLPVQAKPVRAPRTPKEKVPALTLADAQALVTSLYDRSTSDEVTYDLISAEVKKLDKLTAKDLSEVAKHFGVVPGKTKKASLDSILEKITRRKTTHVRNLF